jgi:uncharacterized DUF497 family protein
MKIKKFMWDEDGWNVEHIAKHGVKTQECDEVLQIKFKLFKGRDETYVILGNTKSGRYLFIVMRYLGNGIARPITARDMTSKEKRRFKL